jgi:hypothetical protein
MVSTIAPAYTEQDLQVARAFLIRLVQLLEVMGDRPIKTIPVLSVGDRSVSGGFVNADGEPFRFDITPDTLAYQTIENRRADKDCVIGYACGPDACISRQKQCRIALGQGATLGAGRRRRSTPTERYAKDLFGFAKQLQKVQPEAIGMLFAAAGVGVIGLGTVAFAGYFLVGPGTKPPTPEPYVSNRTPPPRQPEPENLRQGRERAKKRRQQAAQKAKEAAAAAAAAKEAKRQQRRQRRQAQQQDPDVEQLSIDQGIRYVEAPPAKVEKVEVVPETVTGVVDLPLDSIRVAPDLFQYKLPNDVSRASKQAFQERGVTGSLGDTSRWNPNFAGAIQVWRVPKDFKSKKGDEYREGEVLLVHGHHRFDLARRAEEVVVSVNPRVTEPGRPETVRVQFIEADTPKQAKVLGAMQNIADDKGTPRDAANIFRSLSISDPSELKAYGVSIKGSKVAEVGVGLAGLNDRLWESVVNQKNRMSLEKMSAIGGIRNPDLQEEVFKQASDRPGSDLEYVKALSQTVQHQLETGQVSQEESGQGTLFDMGKVVAAVADRAEVDAFIETQISREANFWKRAANPAKMSEILESASAGEIDIERSQEVAQEVAIARHLYRQGKFMNNDPIHQRLTDLLNMKGQELKALRSAGESESAVNTFKARTWEEVRALLADNMGSAL